MRRIDAAFVARLFYGSRWIAVTLSTGRKGEPQTGAAPMRLMGIAALGPKPAPAGRRPGTKSTRILLRNVAIERANQVWCADITYVPMRRGFLHLVAVMDCGAARRCRGGCRTRWTRGFASLLCRKRCGATAARRCSIPTRATIHL